MRPRGDRNRGHAPCQAIPAGMQLRPGWITGTFGTPRAGDAPFLVMARMSQRRPSSASRVPSTAKMKVRPEGVGSLRGGGVAWPARTT